MHVNDLTELERQGIDERNALLVAHRGLVFFMMKRLGLAGHSQADDLSQEGMLALLRALEQFRPEKGVTFSTYACRVIGKHLRQAVRRARRFPVCVAFLADEDEGQPPMEPADHRHAGELLERDRREALETALRRLPERWAAILRARVWAGRKLREVAATLGVSTSAVQQMEAKALARMRTEAPELAELLAG